MKIVMSALLSLASVGFANFGLTEEALANGREEFISLDLYQPLSSGNPNIASSFDLNQLVQNAGETLRGKSILSATVTVGGFGTLALQSGGRVYAQAAIDPNLGLNVLQLNASSPITNGVAQLVLQNGDVFVETIELTVLTAPVILPPPGGFPGQKINLPYHNNVPAGQSLSFQIPAGQVKRISAKWSDNSKNANVDFYIAGQLVGQDVDVASNGKLKVVDINRNFPSSSTLTLVVKRDSIFLEFLEVEYGSPSNRIDINRDFRRDESATFSLNGGNLKELRFSWNDSSRNARTQVWINGNYKGEVDVNSNGDVRELKINEWIHPGSTLTIKVVNDPARIHWVEAVFQ